MSKRIFMHTAGVGACDLHRAIYPYRFCKDELAEQDIILESDLKIDLNVHYDAVIVHRIVNPYFVDVCKKNGIKLVWELDDNLWSVPRWNPASREIMAQQIEWIDCIREEADVIWVTTPMLAGVVGGTKCKVLPNLVHRNAYPVVRNGSYGPPPDKLRVMWAGGCSHHEDLEEVVPAINRLVKDGRDDVVFSFFGYLPEGLCEYYRKPGFDYAVALPRRDLREMVEFIEPTDLDRYQVRLNENQPDISLIPLTDEPFNYSKSNLKWLEMGMEWSAPIVADMPPYADAQHGVDCIKIEPGDWGGWYKAICLLLDDKDVRVSLQNTARENANKYTWQGSKRQIWIDAFKSL